MNLPISPVVSSVFDAAPALDCPMCPAFAGDECVYTTAPVSVPVIPGTPMRPVHGYHAARLDLAGADVATVLGATAIVWDNGDAPRLPVAVEPDADRNAARDVLHQIKEKLDNLGADLCELTAALGGPHGRVAGMVAELLDEPDADDADENEPYCTVCGGAAGIFIGHGDGWHHWRGDGTAASPVELYDAGHAPAVGWREAGAR